MTDWVQRMEAKQRKRQKNFPIDRICFMHGEMYASEDRKIITQYKYGQLTMDQACRAMAANNYLRNVSRVQFKTLLHSLGYDQREVLTDD